LWNGRLGGLVQFPVQFKTLSPETSKHSGDEPRIQIDHANYAMPRRATGSIRKKRDKYQVRWTDHLRRQRTKVLPTRKAAELELKRILLQVEEERQGLRAPSPQCSPLFEELAQEWLDHRAIRKRSKASDQSYIRAHLLPA